MGIVYHGSKEHGLKRLEPRKSTHGIYVYATPEKVLALHFSGRCGDDLTYDIGHFGTDKNSPWQLVENIPGAFEKMYSNSSSIYSFSDETFKNIHTGFEEVVSEVGVDVINEEYCENVYEGLLKAEKDGLVKIYRYPDKPDGLNKDGSDILNKWRFYKEKLNKEFSKHEFDRLVCLRPNLLDKINELIKEFGYDYHYEPKDLIDIYSHRIEKQFKNPENEQFIESSYISICESFPEIKSQIDILYNKYKNEIIIRPLTKEDVAGAAEIRVNGWKTAYKGIIADEHLDSLNIEEQTKKFEKCVGLDNFIVAVQNEKVVGFCRFVYDNSYSSDIDYVDCELSAIYVRPDLKGKGIGAKLFNYVIDKFNKLGKNTMIIWCLADNKKSIDFYKHMGGEIKEKKQSTIGNKEYEEVGLIFNVNNKYNNSDIK